MIIIRRLACRASVEFVGTGVELQTSAPDDHRLRTPPLKSINPLRAYSVFIFSLQKIGVLKLRFLFNGFITS